MLPRAATHGASRSPAPAPNPPAAPDGRVTLAIGEPGSGKTEGQRCDMHAEDLADAATGSAIGRLTLDAHGDLAPKRAADVLAAGRGPDLIYDRVRDTESTVQYRLTDECDPTTVDGLIAEANQIEQLKEAALVKREAGPVHQHPYQESGIEFAGKLVLRGRGRLSSLEHALSLGTVRFDALLDECADREVHERYAEIMSWSKIERERQFHPPRRLLETTFGKPQVAMRLDGTFDPTAWIAEGKELILDGQGVPEDVFRSLGTLVLMRVIHKCMQQRVPARITIDEGNRGFLSSYLSLKAEELRKFGVSLTVLLQSFPSDEADCERWLQASSCLKVYRCGSAQASQRSAEQMSSLVDPYRVHHSEERIQAIPTGYVRETRVTRNRSVTLREGKDGPKPTYTFGESESEHVLPTHDILRQVLPRFWSIPDQLFVVHRDIRRLRTGERYVVERGHVRKERVRLLPATFGGHGAGALAAFLRMQAQRAYFGRPQLDAVRLAASAQDQHGAAWNLKNAKQPSWNGSTIRRRPRK